MSYTNNDESIALVDGNLNPLAVSQSQVITASNQPGYIQMGVSGSTALYMHVTSTGDLFVTGAMTTTPSGVQTITGSTTVNNFPVTQSVKIDQSIILPVSVSFPSIQTVTGTIHFDNASLPVSVSNFPSVQTITGTILSLPFGTQTVTGVVNVNNFPVTQSVRIVAVGTNVTQSITGSVSVVGLTFVSGSNLSVFITSSNTLPVTGTMYIGNASLPVSISNFPAIQTITGSVGISQIVTITGSTTVNNFPVTQSVKIDQSITLPVSVSNFPAIQVVTGTIHFDNANLPVSVSNFPSIQAVTGSVSLSEIATITGSITVNNPTVFPTTQSVKLVDIGTNVTQSVTGTISVNNFPSIQTVTGTVHFDNSNLPVTVSNFPAIQTVTGSVGISQIVNITGSTTVNNFPVTQSVKIDQSTILSVTGTVHFDNINLPVSVSNFPATQNITGSVTINNPTVFAVTQSVKIDQSIILPISVSNFPVIQTITGSITINNFPLVQTITGSIGVNGLTFVSGSNLSVFISASNTLPVSGTVHLDNSILPVSVSFPSVQTVTGTVHFDNANMPVSVSNFPSTQTITGSVTINNPVSVVNQGTSGSIPWKMLFNDGVTTFGSASANPIWVTGSFTQNNFPLTQSVKIDQSVILPISVSNFPTTQIVTGSVTINNPTVLPVTQSVKIDQTITLPVSVSNFPTVQAVTGTVHFDNTLLSVSVSNFPVTQSVKIDQSTTLPITGTVHFDNANLPVSVSNFPAVQTVTGSVTINNQTVFPVTQSVKIDQSITLPVSVSFPSVQTVTGTLHVDNAILPVTGTVTVAGLTFVSGSNLSVFVSASNTLPVSVSFPSVQTVTGTVHFDNANLPVSVSNFPTTQTITGSVTINNPISTVNQGISGSTSWLVTGSFFQINQPVTQSVKIDQSVILPISVSNFPSTQVVTGTVHFDNANLPVSVSNFPAIQTVTGSVTINNPTIFPVTQSVKIDQSITLPVSVSNFPITQVVTGTVHFDNATLPVSVSNFPVIQSVTGTVGISQIVTITGSVTQNNFPVTQSIKIDQSITLPVSVSNFPVIQTITGSVTVNNPISTVIQGTSGSIPWKVLFNDGVTTFGSASANPIWVTGSFTQNNFPLTQSVKIDQSIILPVTGTIHFDNINLPISVSNFPTVQTVTGTLHLDNVFLPVSVSNLPTTQSVKIDSWFGSNFPTVGQKNTTGSIPVVVANDINQKLTAQIFGYTYSSYSPDPSSHPVTLNTPITLDSSNRLEVHASTTTDEGSFRDDFSNTSLSSSLTGNITFTNGSFVLNGVGTLFTSEVAIGQWIEKTTDSETFFGHVTTVGSDTQITLESAYTGTTATTTGVISDWLTVTPTGGSITVVNSLVSIGSGTANGATGYIQRTADYGPFTLSVLASVSQRIANQTSIIGFRDNFSVTTKQAVISFTGTSNTQVSLITSFSAQASDIQTTTVTLPNGATTNNLNLYKIDVSGTQVTLSINGVIVASHNQHIPGPYDVLNVYAGTLNSAVVTSTTLSIDYYYFSNVDRIQIDNDFQGEPIAVQGLSANGQPVSGSPLLVAGTDGTNTRTLKTATDGTLFITGSISTVSSNPSVAGNNAAIPTSSSLAGGSDGTNIRPIKVLSDGTQVITGSVNVNNLTFVSGSNLSVFITSSNVLPVTGTVLSLPFGTQVITGTVHLNNISLPVSVSNFPSIQTVTGSITITSLSASYGGQVEGLAPNATTVVGNPVLIAGSDGTNAYTIETDTIGRVRTTYPNIITYAGSSNGTVGSGTAAATVTSIGYIWHTATNSKRIEIYRITVSTGGGAAGNLSLRGAFITAENGTPGGLVYPPTPLVRSSAASTITGSTGILRVGPAAPTRVAGDLITETVGGGSTGAQYVLFESANSGQPIVLRSGSAEGFEIRSVVGVALTTAAQISFTVYWTET